MQVDLGKLVADRLGISELAPIPNRYGSSAYKFSCLGSEVLDRWQKLRNLADESGYWPVILGDEKEAGRILGIEELPPQQILDDAATQISEQWLAARSQSRTEQEGALRGIFEKRYGARAEEMWKQLEQLRASAPQPSRHGEWPDQPRPMTRFTIPFERVGEGLPKPNVTVGLFPTKHGWEVPAYLNFGGWNECPEPAGHVVMMKHWFDEYGAELVGMNGDTVEMFATRPPLTRSGALKLAEEQFLYCDDIVIQGTQTIEALGAGLLGNNIWFFWWD
jgi:Domain of unknown function (DUF4253)